MELIYKDTKYTEEMLMYALAARDEFDKRNEQLTQLAKQQEDELSTIRGEVFDFFNEAFTPGEDELTFSLDSINELLESIGCLKLKSLFTVRAYIDVTVSGIEAEDQDAAEAEFQDQIKVEWDAFEGRIEEFTVDVRKVEAE